MSWIAEHAAPKFGEQLYDGVLRNAGHPHGCPDAVPSQSAATTAARFALFSRFILTIMLAREGFVNQFDLSVLTAGLDEITMDFRA